MQSNQFIKVIMQRRFTASYRHTDHLLYYYTNDEASHTQTRTNKNPSEKKIKRLPWRSAGSPSVRRHVSLRSHGPAAESADSDTTSNEPAPSHSSPLMSMTNEALPALVTAAASPSSSRSHTVVQQAKKKKTTTTKKNPLLVSCALFLSASTRLPLSSRPLNSLQLVRSHARYFIGFHQAASFLTTTETQLSAACSLAPFITPDSAPLHTPHTREDLLLGVASSLWAYRDRRLAPWAWRGASYRPLFPKHHLNLLLSKTETGGSNEREIRSQGCFPGFGALGGLLPHGGYSPPFGGCGASSMALYGV